jgi:hypothetical protein
MDFNQFSKLYEVSLFNKVFSNWYLAVYNNCKSSGHFNSILGYKLRNCIITELRKSLKNRDFSTSEILLWYIITVWSITFFAQSPIRQELTLK